MKSKRKTAPRKSKDPNVYPPGWNERRVEAIIDYYDARKDQDVMNDAEVTRSAAGVVWMEVPQELVTKVRQLIERHRRTA